MEYLDTIEGVPEGIYYRQKVLVLDEGGKLLEAETYRTTDPKGPYTPTRRYLGLMIKRAPRSTASTPTTSRSWKNSTPPWKNRAPERLKYPEDILHLIQN